MSSHHHAHPSTTSGHHYVSSASTASSSTLPHPTSTPSSSHSSSSAAAAPAAKRHSSASSTTTTKSTTPSSNYTAPNAPLVRKAKVSNDNVPPIVVPPPDQFYGHEVTATMAARLITNLFACPDIPPPTTPPTPQPPLANFIAYSLHRTRLPHLVTISALLLLNRLKQRFPAARGSSGHRLFISAFMMASKVICDDTYSNKSWCVVAQGMFALKEINQMEREMLGYLEWQVNVVGSEVIAYEAEIKRDFGSESPLAPVAVAAPVTPSSLHPTSQPFKSTTPTSTVEASTTSAPYPSPPHSPSSSSGGSSGSESNSPASVGSNGCKTPPDGATLSGGPASLKGGDGRHHHNQHHHVGVPNVVVFSGGDF